MALFVACVWLQELAESAALSRPALVRYEFSERQMGVEVRLTFYARSSAAAMEAASAAFREIDALEDRLSDYDEASEARRALRAADGGRPVGISAEFHRGLLSALRFRDQSQGAFDPSVGALSRLWRDARARGVPPDPRAQDLARQSVGNLVMTCEPFAPVLSSLGLGTVLDFGGIGKGQAADIALKALGARGIQHALVALAGDIAVSGPPPGQPGWRIGITSLEDPEGDPILNLVLGSGAVSTSGDAFQHLEHEGRRLSHVLDARRGTPSLGKRSVTVVAPTGEQSDALATTAMILGFEESQGLLERTPGASLLWQEVTPSRPLVLASPRWRLLHPVP